MCLYICNYVKQSKINNILQNKIISSGIHKKPFTFDVGIISVRLSQFAYQSVQLLKAKRRMPKLPADIMGHNVTGT